MKSRTHWWLILFSGKEYKHPSSGWIFWAFTVGTIKVITKHYLCLFVTLLSLTNSFLKINWCVGVFFGSVVTSSPELQALLMNQLTIKVIFSHSFRSHESFPHLIALFLSQGLKKLGQSIESSYSTIQKLVISHLQRYFLIFSLKLPPLRWLTLAFCLCVCRHSGSEALLYHLSEVKGMSLWKQKFEPLGLDAAAIEGTPRLIYCTWWVNEIAPLWTLIFYLELFLSVRRYHSCGLILFKSQRTAAVSSFFKKKSIFNSFLTPP